MLPAEATLLSTQYRAIASLHQDSINNLNTSSLEALLLRVIIYQADNRIDVAIKTFLDAIPGQRVSWLFVANLLTRQLFRQIGLGPGCTSRRAEDVPVHTKKEMAFQENIQPQGKPLFRDLISDYKLEMLVPENIDSYNAQFLRCSTFVNYTRSQLTKLLSLEGESWIGTTPYPQLLVTLKEIAQILVEDTSLEQSYKLLLKARLDFAHNLVLNLPVGSLSVGALDNYRKYMQQLFRKENALPTAHYISLQLEYFNALLFNYKYIEAEVVLEQCKRVLNMDVEFTGKLGRRTKFQQFDTPQLVVNITQFKEKEPQPGEEIPMEELNLIPVEQLLQLDSETPNQLQGVNLEDDSILFQYPKLNQQNSKVELDVLKQLTLLNITYYMYQTTPKDELLFLKISSMLAPLLESSVPVPYAIKHSLLLLRSLNELPRYKNSDRALEQLQQIVSEHSSAMPSDLSYILSTPSNYRIHLIVVKIVAEKVMHYGLVMTGVQMYEKAGMFEECVEGLVSAGHKTKAIALAKKLLQEQGNDPSPRLLCLLGDATGEEDLYHKSWQASKHTFARAQRTLGRLYFFKKEYSKSVQSFKKSLQVNFYNPSSWFTLGCAHMQLIEYSEAIKAFSQSININDSQGEGWGNLASCYIGLKKYKEAYGALDHALKHSESSWKLWSNMLGISLKVKKFYKYMECIIKLINIDMTKLIVEDTLEKLNQILAYKLSTMSEQRKRITSTYKRRLDETYSHVKTLMGEKSFVWKQYVQYLKLNVLYEKQISQHYSQLHATSSIDLSDMVEGYEDPHLISESTQLKVQQLEIEMVESKQKQLNMAMQIGWQTQKSKRDSIKNTLAQYKSVYSSYYQVEDQDFKTFTKSIQQKIHHAQRS